VHERRFRDQHKNISTSLSTSAFATFARCSCTMLCRDRGRSIPDWVVLPSSLRMYGPRGRQELESLSAAGSEVEEDGDESVVGGGTLEEDVETVDEDDVMVGLPWSPHGHGSPPHIVQQHFSILQATPATRSIPPFATTHASTQILKLNPPATPSQTVPLQCQHFIPPHPRSHLPPRSIRTRTPQRLTTLRISFVEGHAEHRAIGSSSKLHWLFRGCSLPLGQYASARVLVRRRGARRGKIGGWLDWLDWLVALLVEAQMGAVVASAAGSPFSHSAELTPDELEVVVSNCQPRKIRALQGQQVRWNLASGFSQNVVSLRTI